MEKFIEELLKEMIKESKKQEKKFISAEKLGICQGDRIFYKDGEVSYVRDVEDLRVNYKNIQCVERPVEWEEIKIRRPRFGRRKKGE